MGSNENQSAHTNGNGINDIVRIDQHHCSDRALNDDNAIISGSALLASNQSPFCHLSADGLMGVNNGGTGLFGSSIGTFSAATAAVLSQQTFANFHQVIIKTSFIFIASL